MCGLGCSSGYASASYWFTAINSNKSKGELMLLLKGVTLIGLSAQRSGICMQMNWRNPMDSGAMTEMVI